MTAPGWGRWLLVPGGLALVSGLDAGLTLAGAPAPVPSLRLAQLHGPLMALGFLGTVIALERATALRAAWGYAAPALLGLGALLLALLPHPLAGRLALAQGAATLVLVYAALHRRNHDLTVAVEALGAVLATAAALLLTRMPVAPVLPLLLGFIVLTIGAERVELARLAMPRGADRTLLLLTAPAALLAVLAAALPSSAPSHLLGATLLALTGWLVRHDVARRTVRVAGLPRFSAVALLAGYAWLAVAACVLLLTGRPSAVGPAYDVLVHATFLGFAMSMVLAHAPVILPAVLRVRLPYHPVHWVPLVLLHASLLLRVASTVLGATSLWRGALVANVTAVLLFLLLSATTVLVHLRRRGGPPRRSEHHA